MKKIVKRWIPFSIVLLVSALLITVGMATAETYVITGGGGIVTVDGPSVDISSAGGLSKANGDITVAKTDSVTSSGKAAATGSASAGTESGPATSATVSWANLGDKVAGYSYALAIGIPDESGNVVMTDVSSEADVSASGFFTDESGSAEVQK